MSAAARTVRCLVTGRVQGVFYRASTAREAERLGLRGCARNLSDGSVEVIASGEAAAIADLCRWLWQGPPAATVTEVSIEESDPSACPEDGFRVL